MPNLTISQALAQADLLVDRPTIDKAIAGIADAIARDYKGEVPLFLSIMHGALPFAGQLALELGARGQDVQFDYLHATRYRGETTGGDLVWKHKPATSLFGRRVLLVDDILDEGYTLQGVRQWCLEQGATDVRIAALAIKQARGDLIEAIFLIRAYRTTLPRFGASGVPSAKTYGYRPSSEYWLTSRVSRSVVWVTFVKLSSRAAT